MPITGHEDYPVAVVEDRYGGTYSGGEWLAIAEAAELFDAIQTRAQFCLTDAGGPSGDDRAAAEFWAERPSWIAPGATPEAAIQNLRVQSASTS